MVALTSRRASRGGVVGHHALVLALGHLVLIMCLSKIAIDAEQRARAESSRALAEAARDRQQTTAAGLSICELCTRTARVQ